MNSERRRASGELGSKVARLGLAPLLLAGVLFGPTMLAHATPLRLSVATNISLLADAGTARVGSVVSASGTVTPVAPGRLLAVQQLVSGRWRVLSHLQPDARGSFTFRERAPKLPGAWTLRVTRAGGPGVGVGVSPALHVNVVSVSFSLVVPVPASTLPAGHRLILAGQIHPATSGSVYLERRTPGGGWVLWAQARVIAGTRFTIITTPLPAGVYTFRPAKFFSPTVAAGAGRWFTVTVQNGKG